jgi:hypothetical protein
MRRAAVPRLENAVVEIKWNEEELARVLQAAAEEFADQHQSDMDELSQRFNGRPVDEIKPVLDSEMTRWGGSFSDDAELTRVATAISQGEDVKLRPAG